MPIMSMAHQSRSGVIGSALAGFWVAIPGIMMSVHSAPTMYVLGQKALFVKLYGIPAAQSVASLGDGTLSSTLASLLLFPVLLVGATVALPKLEIRQFISTVPTLVTMVLTYVLASQVPTWLITFFQGSMAVQPLARAHVLLGCCLAMTSSTLLVARLAAWPKTRLVRLIASIVTVACLAVLIRAPFGSWFKWFLPTGHEGAVLGGASGTRLVAYLCLTIQIGLWMASAWFCSFRFRRLAPISQ